MHCQNVKFVFRVFGNQIAQKEHGSAEFIDSQAAQDAHFIDSYLKGIEVCEFAMVFENMNLRHFFSNLNQFPPLLQGKESLQIGNQTLEVFYHNFNVVVHHTHFALSIVGSPL